jgi:hypothetical protein
VFNEVNSKKHRGDTEVKEVDFASLIAKPYEGSFNKGSVIFSTSAPLEIYGCLLEFL